MPPRQEGTAAETGLFYDCAILEMGMIECQKNAAEQAAQAQKQPVPMPTTYEALRHDLIASGRAYDFDMIDRAYQLASAAHATQFRRSGEPYICHPISVAQLLVELGMDSESVAAALMH